MEAVLNGTARVQSELAGRLRRLRGEIEAAALLGVRHLPESKTQPPEYVEGLREALKEALGYVVAGIERGESWSEPVPPAVTTQARRAARAGIRLDVVLRRYAAADRLLTQIVIAEAESFPVADLRRTLAAIGPLVDRLMAEVSTQYREESERIRRSPDERLAERVQWHLEDNASADAWDLDYELESWHLGMIFPGAGSRALVESLTKGYEGRWLVVPRNDGRVWAWLGGQARPLAAELDDLLAATSAMGMSVAVGEPRFGINGWRQTHREADAAFEVMLRRPDRVIRSCDALILAAVLRDESLAESLIETFLAPLDEQSDLGSTLRATLRAYLHSGFNAATTAAALGVNRHTVKRRIHKIEEVLGRLISSCHAELEVALSLEELVSGPGAMSRQLA